MKAFSPPGLVGVVQLVASHIKDAIPAGAVILESDLRRQFHKLFFGKLRAQSSVQIVRNVRRHAEHLVGKFNHQALGIVEYGKIDSLHGGEFLVIEACISAHGRIDIDSKRAADARSGSHLGKLAVAQRHLPFL